MIAQSASTNAQRNTFARKVWDRAIADATPRKARQGIILKEVNNVLIGGIVYPTSSIENHKSRLGRHVKTS